MSWKWERVQDGVVWWVPRGDPSYGGGTYSNASGGHDGKLYFAVAAVISFGPRTPVEPMKWRSWSPADPTVVNELAIPTDLDGSGFGVWGNDGKFYYMGGQHYSDGTDSREVWAYTPGTDSWEQKADLPSPPYSLSGFGEFPEALAAWEDKIYQFGDLGYPAPDNGQHILEYDTGSDTWTDLGALFSNFRGNGMVAVPVPGQGIFLFGGDTSPPDVDTKQVMDLFDPSDNSLTAKTWHPIEGGLRVGYVIGLTTNGAGIPSVVTDYGNFNYPDLYDGETWSYDPAVDTWTALIPEAEINYDEGEWGWQFAGGPNSPAGIIDGVWYMMGTAEEVSPYIDTLSDFSVWRLVPSEFDEGWGVTMSG